MFLEKICVGKVMWVTDSPVINLFLLIKNIIVDCKTAQP